MAGSSNANNVPKGTTLDFGSWACTADGLGGFSSHLVTPNSPELKTINQPVEFRKAAELDGKQAPLEQNSDTVENVSTSTRAESAEFDTNSDSEKPHFSETLQKIRDLSQVNQTPQDHQP